MIFSHMLLGLISSFKGVLTSFYGTVNNDASNDAIYPILALQNDPTNREF